MQGTAALITAIAALVGALAWPIAVTFIFVRFRKQLGVVLDKLPSMVARMQKVKIGAFEAELAKESGRLVEDTVAHPETISSEQIRSSVRMKIAAQSLDQQSLRDQIQQLCMEYDIIRKVLPASAQRVRAMTEVLVRMRTIGPAAAVLIEELKRSTSPGSHLAAIAIMQVDPDNIDFDWLLERFRSDAPFIFYHGALALQNAALAGGPSAVEAIKASREALKVVENFAGEPDLNTVNILRQIETSSKR